MVLEDQIPPSSGGSGPKEEGKGPPPKELVRVIVNQTACERTGVCEQVCPEDVFLFENSRTRVIRASNCTYCWICVENCVSGAITLD